MDEQRETCAGAGSRPLQHLKVAVRVAKRGNRPSSNTLLNAHRLSFLVVDEVDLRELDKHRPPVSLFEFQLAAAANDLLRRDAVDALGPRTHEFHAAARHDVGFESVCAQISE